MLVDYGRQAAIIDPDQAKGAHVNIIGLGTVGSHSAVELARLGIGSLRLIDMDKVEAVNLPSQAYHVSDIGRDKAEALHDRVRDVSDHISVDYETCELYGGEILNDGPVIMAVDSMDARKNILELSLTDRPGHKLVVDGRMAGKTLQLIAFDPNDEEAVNRWHNDPIFGWFPQNEALQLPCGGRSVSFIGAAMGSLIASYICRHIVGSGLPLFQQFDLDSYHNLLIK